MWSGYVHLSLGKSPWFAEGRQVVYMRRNSDRIVKIIIRVGIILWVMYLLTINVK